MPAWLIPALAAGAPLASSALNAFMQYKTNETQIRLANTAHQREVADLRKAGLNPIISAGGKGAPMPAMSAPSVDVAAPVNSAMAARMNQGQLANLEAQTAKTLAEAQSAKTAAKLNDQTYWFNYQNAEADAALRANAVFKSDAENSVLKQYKQSLLDNYNQIHTAAQAARLSIPELQAEAAMYSSPLGKYTPYIKTLLQSGHSAAHIYDALRR